MLDKKRVLTWIVTSLLILPQVFAQSSVHNFFVEFYNLFNGWFDFFIYFTAFGTLFRIAVEKNVGADKIKETPYKLLYFVLALVTTLGVIFWQQQAGFSLLDVGPLALILAAGILIFNFIALRIEKKQGKPEQGLGILWLVLLAGVLFYVWLVYPFYFFGYQYQLLGDRIRVSDILLWGLIAGCSGLIGWVAYKAFKRGKTSQNASSEPLNWAAILLLMAGIIVGSGAIGYITSLNPWVGLGIIAGIIGIIGVAKRLRHHTQPSTTEKKPVAASALGGNKPKEPKPEKTKKDSRLKKIKSAIGGWLRRRVSSLQVEIKIEPEERGTYNLYNLEERKAVIRLRAEIKGGSGDYTCEWDIGTGKVQNLPGNVPLDVNLYMLARSKKRETLQDYKIIVKVTDNIYTIEGIGVKKFKILTQPLKEDKKDSLWKRTKKGISGLTKKVLGLKVTVRSTPLNKREFILRKDTKIDLVADVERGSGDYTYIWKFGVREETKDNKKDSEANHFEASLVGLTPGSRKVELIVVDNKEYAEGRDTFDFRIVDKRVILNLETPRSGEVIRKYVGHPLKIKFEVENESQREFITIEILLAEGFQIKENIIRKGPPKNSNILGTLAHHEREYVLPPQKLAPGQYTIILAAVDQQKEILADVFFLEVIPPHSVKIKRPT